MKESTQQLTLNAEETLYAANVLIKENLLRDAVNRAYYAVFYMAEALLNEKDLRFKKHGSVHGSFSRYFVKTGVLRPNTINFSRSLLDNACWVITTKSHSLHKKKSIKFLNRPRIF